MLPPSAFEARVDEAVGACRAPGIHVQRVLQNRISRRPILRNISRVDPLFEAPDPARVRGAHVTFERARKREQRRLAQRDYRKRYDGLLKWEERK